MIININGVEHNVACVETMRDLMVKQIKEQIKEQIINNLINSIRIDKTKKDVATSYTNRNVAANTIKYNSSMPICYVYNNACNYTSYYPITNVYIV